MQFQEIDEAVEVWLRVGAGKITPERVRWGQTEYHVVAVHNVWRQKLGQHAQIHLACTTRENAALELVIDPIDLSCRLARLSVG
ncbi:hypothetical protein HUU05_10120 [candidate division KSB1 bacterium]|nr:hypothetical protein [candidate division KSB1 bacterium]